MTHQYFAALEARPDDPILGLNVLYKQDTRDTKVNLGVGVFLDEEGRLPLMAAVGQAEARLVERGAPHNYIPMSGLPAYCQSLQALVFGADNEAVLSGRIATIQSLGGTGALHLGAMFAHLLLNLNQAVVSNPTWGNHITLFEHAGFTVGKYPYFDPTTKAVDFEGLMASLQALEPGTVVLLHACCHNPTGVDLTYDQWTQVIEVLQARDLFPFLDIAYQGFGSGLDEDATAVRRLAAAGMTFMVASSCSKNFGLYGERTGALHVVTPNAKEAAVVTSILKSLVRAEYSNPPTHGAAVVAEILTDDALRQVWVNKVTTMRTRILAMRHRLKEEGDKLNADLSFATRQTGMFSFTGLNKDQMLALRETFGVYGVTNGRICIAGLNENNVSYVAKALAGVR